MAKERNDKHVPTWIGVLIILGVLAFFGSMFTSKNDFPPKPSLTNDSSVIPPLSPDDQAPQARNFTSKKDFSTSVVLGSQPVCFNKDALIQYISYVVSNSMDGLIELQNTKQCFTVPTDQVMRISDNVEVIRSPLIADGEPTELLKIYYPENGNTLWVVEASTRAKKVR